MKNLLKFGRAKKNNKLFANPKAEGLYTFSLPSGFSCPGAQDCLSKADRFTGKIKDGPVTQFRCFSASQENLYSNVRKSRWRNFELLRNTDNIEKLILNSLPTKATAIRIHVAGDFYSAEYFKAWCEVAKAKPQILFYAYTKSLLYWIANRQDIPKNFRLIASFGGRYDSLIAQHNLPNAKVVYSKKEARSAKLKLDHDDSLAMNNRIHSFGLLLHGIQPKDSIAGKAMSALRMSGESGYGATRRLSLTVLAA